MSALSTELPALRQTVIEGKAYSIMCAYNRINGEPACANTFLLGDTLRDAWKFTGYVVSDCGAIADINRFGSAHSDAIITRDELAAKKFLAGVDSATVYWNASTRFTDGFEFGLGAEIGISTDRLHARGPMGLRELCSYKYLIYGTGQVRE